MTWSHGHALCRRALRGRWVEAAIEARVQEKGRALPPAPGAPGSQSRRRACCREVQHFHCALGAQQDFHRQGGKRAHVEELLANDGRRVAGDSAADDGLEIDEFEIVGPVEQKLLCPAGQGPGKISTSLSNRPRRRCSRERRLCAGSSLTGLRSGPGKQAARPPGTCR